MKIGEQVGTRELFALLTLYAATDIFLSYPQQLVARGAQAGWMIPLLGMIPALAAFFLVERFMRRRKPMGLLQWGEEAGGTIGGALIGVLLVVYFILVAASEVRQFTETVVATVLPRSPVGFVAVPFLLVIIYFAYTGIEGLTRVSLLVGPWLLLGLFLLLALNLNWAKPSYLLPLWGKGMEHIVQQGAVFSGIYTNGLILFLLASLVREQQELQRMGKWSILFVALLYTLVMVVFVMVFPVDAASRMPFPLYQFARLIYLGRFVQRLEAAFVFIWVACAVIKMALALWLASFITAQIWKMPVCRPLVYPFALIIYSLSFLPRNFSAVLTYDIAYLYQWGWLIVVVLPILVVTAAFVRRRKGADADEKNTHRSS